MELSEVETKLKENYSKVDKLKHKYDLWSISKINTFENCPQEYYLSYIKKAKSLPNVYGVLGGIVHEVIEELYLGKITKPEAFVKFNQEFNNNLDLKFPSDSIKKSWYDSIVHFLLSHKVEVDSEDTNIEILTEQLCLTVINGNIFRGYIDMIIKRGEEFEILDWKTSSKFSGTKLTHAGRQLIFYKIALEKQLGIEVKTLKWNMLKYARVTYTTETGRLSTKIEQRNKIKFMKNVSLIEDYVLEYESTEEKEQEVKKYFTDIIRLIKEKEKLAERQDVKYRCTADEFFCNNLCGFKQVCPRFNSNPDTEEFVYNEEDLL